MDEPPWTSRRHLLKKLLQQETKGTKPKRPLQAQGKTT